MAELTTLTDSVLSGKQEEENVQHSPGNDARIIEEERSCEKIAQLADENARLKVRQSQLQDQLEELKRQVFAEKSARQTLTAELEDAKERLQRSKDHLDQQKRDYNGLSLQLCTVKAERDELEAKVNEVWESMAVLEEVARGKDATNQSLREALDNEKRERAAQDVLMSAMVTQLAGLEERTGVVAEAEERQRRVFEETLRSISEEAQRVARKLESLSDYNSIATLEPQRKALLLSENPYNDGTSLPSNAGVVSNSGSPTDDGLNTSDMDGVDREETQLKSDIRLLNPIHQALRHLRRQIQQEREGRYNMQQERSVLETHIRSLKDELRRLGDDNDGVREKLFKSEAQWAHTTETLESIRQARAKEAAESADARRRLALLLHSLDDWCVIEQRVSDLIHDTRRLRSVLEESRRMHETYVLRKEEEMDSLTDMHQRELDGQQRQMEQIRHECERYKRAVGASSGPLALNTSTGVSVSDNSAAATTTTTTGIGNTSIIHNTSCSHGATMTELQFEHETLKVKYCEVLQYVETELEPLAMEQAKTIEKERKRLEELQQTNDVLRREVSSLNNSRKESNGKLTLFEALVLTVRVLSGTMADIREMAQQRTALTRYILAYEQMFGPLNVCGDSTRSRAVMRFRRVVVGVLAVNRLLKLCRLTSCVNSRNCRSCSDIIIPAERRRGGRIRLPLETYCLVRDGLTQLPPIKRGGDGLEYLKDRVGKGRGDDVNDIVFVNEQDLQLPVLSPKASSDTLRIDVVSQYSSLRNFIDSLLSFVTVPSVQQSLYRVEDPLWRRLSNGLRALQRTARPNRHSTHSSEPHRLLHLPPRVPERESISPEYALPRSNITHPVVNTNSNGSVAIPIPVPAAGSGGGAQRTSHYNSESAFANQKRPARALSYSIGRTHESDVEKNSNVYPTPQPIDHSKETLQSVEEALQRSLLRDALDCNSSQGSQVGNGFVAEVLSVIQALDQRVMGALEHRSKVEEWRPRR
ncbi:uncharacterized protein TM35_000152760 [Trypanosoma theileri]|uniref:Uncharacterized protein n=1 Tax=Trypanosoma theileri TaxID=67003 RepID=A0A1X0NVW9_9TRYP|nr:uncharacterized protein TM35_000152760 [Trypanosoma theileri]ORC88845.1 hypothetical protein TM35_000152760 [Trypanosoma theileri]